MGHLVVVGAGTMGSGIATVAIQGGLSTKLIDLDDGQLAEARSRIERGFARQVTRGAMTNAEVAEALSHLTVSTDLPAVCEGAVAAIEAVFEDLEVKTKVLGDLAANLDEDALVASNTSALSVTELANAVTPRERVVGMHFFNPVPRMPLCEIVRGVFTSDESIARARDLAARLGKQTVVVQDVPGFATSRLSALLGNEAFRMLEEGVASAEDIDTAVRLGLNHPMGPLELGDLVGLDVRLSVLSELTLAFGDRFRPTNLHRRLVAAGRLGRKTGRGVFEYPEE